MQNDKFYEYTLIELHLPYLSEVEFSKTLKEWLSYRILTFEYSMSEM